jgi:hypothetical protein
LNACRFECQSWPHIPMSCVHDCQLIHQHLIFTTTSSSLTACRAQVERDRALRLLQESEEKKAQVASQLEAVSSSATENFLAQSKQYSEVVGALNVIPKPVFSPSASRVQTPMSSPNTNGADPSASIHFCGLASWFSLLTLLLCLGM